MNDEMMTIYKKRVERTIENLQKNNMEGYFCENSQQARELVKKLINKGDVISSGGSVTLKETGIIDIIKSDEYKYIDRSEPNIMPEESEKRMRESFFADAYFASANAVTENGEIYNVDGNCNRVAAIIYGPKSVILVCGCNKIVKDIDEAIKRVKTTAAPQNTIRLNKNTYCSKNGECVACANGAKGMTDGCRSPERICCTYAVCAQQRVKGRIKVIFIGEELGY